MIEPCFYFKIFIDASGFSYKETFQFFFDYFWDLKYLWHVFFTLFSIVFLVRNRFNFFFPFLWLLGCFKTITTVSIFFKLIYSCICEHIWKIYIPICMCVFLEIFIESTASYIGFCHSSFIIMFSFLMRLISTHQALFAEFCWWFLHVNIRINLSNSKWKIYA